MIRLDLSKTTFGKDIFSYENEVRKIHQMIHQKSGLGNDYLGWVNYPSCITDNDLKRIQKIAQKVQKECDALVVIGIGGSYLGAKAAIDAINGLFKTTSLEIIYLGNTLSPFYTF